MLRRYKDSDIILVGDDEPETSKLALHVSTLFDLHQGNLQHFMLEDVVSSAEFLCRFGLVLDP